MRAKAAAQAGTLASLSVILRRLWPYLQREKILLAGGFAALLAQVGLRLLEPWPLKFILDRVIVSPTGAGSGLAFIDRLEPVTLLTYAALAFVVVVGLRAAAEYATTVSFVLSGNRVLSGVRARLYSHLQRLPLSYHTGAKSGDLTLRVISDVGTLRDVAVTAFLPLLGNALILLGMLGVMFALQWQLALVTLGIFPLFWLVSVRQSRRIHRVSRQQRKRDGAMAATAAETIGAIKLVQALSLEKTFARSFNKQNEKSLKEGVQAKRLAAGLERSVDVLIAVATAVVLYYGAWLVLGSALTPGDLIVFITYLKTAFKPVKNFAKYTGRLARAAAAGERVISVLDTEPDICDRVGARSAPALKGYVRFDGVSFAYKAEHPVLKNISFEIKPGERVAVVGASGGDKSTLASLLPRLYDPTDGRISVDGHDLRDLTLASLRAQISVVLQDNLLFGASVRDNIAFGADNPSQDEVKAAARLAHAHEFIMCLPQGYDTVLGERGVTLSGGQRQRIAVARAAVRRAPLLILDEPTVALDEENERLVTVSLKRLAENQSTLLITHDLRFASSADKILYLENGCVTEMGSHDELLDLNGRYAALYRLQMLTHVPQEKPIYAYAS